MKYFAMLGETRVGPLSLEELADLGVRPDTYIWCKGMDDWERADENGDICRYFRQRLSELRHPTPKSVLPTVAAEENPAEEDEDYSAVPPRFRYMVQRYGGPAPEKADHDPADHDPATPPPPGMLTLAILVTVICFPFTGAAAIYYAVRARNFWAEAKRSDSKTSGPLYSEKEREEIRKDMADSVRQCKMWTGITVCIGVMMYAALIHLI